MQAVLRGFERDAAVSVGDEPVQLGKRHPGGKRDIRDVQPLKHRARLRNTGAAAEQPRYQLKLRDIILAVYRRMILRVADEVQSRDAETLFVHRVIVERVAVLHMGHADDRIAVFELLPAAQVKGIPARRDGNALSVGKFIVKVSSEIKVLRQICRSCAHCAPSNQ